MRQLGFLLLVLMTTATFGAAPVTIIVNPGNFDTVEIAACAENKINFWDDDFTDDRACTESFAALELKNFLLKVTNLKESDITFADTNIPAQGDVFIIGSKDSNPFLSDEDAKFESPESFKITAKKDNDRIITKIQGSDRVGTLYGVYRYLNKLGIHFYGLGDNGTVYPPGHVSIIEEMNIIENPSYLTRGFYVWEDRKCEDEFFIWMARNRLDLWTSVNQPVPLLKKLGMRLADGSHDMHRLYLNPDGQYPYNNPKFQGDEDKPEDPYKSTDEYTGDTNNDGTLTYFEAHPEWYGLHDGKRSKNIVEWQGDNFCTSNPDARKELVKNFVQDVIAGSKTKTDTLKIGMLDCGRWCECENCKNSGNYTSRVFIILNDLLKEVKLAQANGTLKRRVDIKMSAYSETLSPPDRPLPEGFDYENCSVSFAPVERCYCHSFADPSCSEINAGPLRAYQGWTIGDGRNYKGAMTVSEYYNISSLKSLPTLYTKLMSSDIPWFFRNGARHFRYMHTPTKLWGTWTLNQNLFAELLWNVDLDVNKFLDEYFTLYYPTTSRHTRKFYEHLETAMIQTKSFKHFVSTTKGPFTFRSWTGLITGEKKDIFPINHMKYEKYSPLTNDAPDMVEIMDNLRLARKEIDAALIQCTDKNEQLRLIEDERRFAYGESMINFFYHLVRTAMFHNNENAVMARLEFALVKKYAEELKQVTDLIKVASEDANDENGYLATQMMDVYELYEKKYGN